MNHVERLRIASIAAPLLRNKVDSLVREGKGDRPRRLNAVDASGRVVRVVSDVEFAEALLAREKVELEVLETVARLYCKKCGTGISRRNQIGYCRLHLNLARTPEQRSAIAKQATASITPIQRSETARKANAALTPEQRSAMTKKALASLTHEQLVAAGRKSGSIRRDRASMRG